MFIIVALAGSALRRSAKRINRHKTAARIAEDAEEAAEPLADARGSESTPRCLQRDRQGVGRRFSSLIELFRGLYSSAGPIVGSQGGIGLFAIGFQHFAVFRLADRAPNRVPNEFQNVDAFSARRACSGPLRFVHLTG